MTLHEIPNGKFRVPGWAKPIIFAAFLTTVGWATLDYVATMHRLTVLETSYANIIEGQTRMEKSIATLLMKVDELNPDYGPAINPSGGGR